MTVEELTDLFESSNDEEFLKFERISRNPGETERPDLFAFALLDKLVPGTTDIVSSAEHDQIFLETSIEHLAEVINAEQVITLIRCGVMYDSEFEALSMFV